ncbi:MAG: carbamoyltransferase HypF, partial [bacterium]|nr:carbamoyltransferase HypF [bacterium]
MANAIRRFRTRVRILGITQGVGFRPFVWRLAQEFGLSGWVQNDSSGLLLEIQGATGSIDGFLQRLADSPPTLAQIDAMDIQAIPAVDATAEFLIRESQEQAGESSPVTQDISVCGDCLHELQDPQDRRYGYAFINCTNCGPRFTIVENLPYDRSATTMKSFSMCQRCQSEYDDPNNRRFHAQPNACPDCGPCVWFVAGDDVARALEAPSEVASQGAAAIRACKEALMAGQIIATKGIGGFHLVCSASNTDAVAALRQRKGRVDKPFAIMVADVAQAREMAEVSDFEAQILSSRQRPIVLLSKSQSTDYAAMHDAVAPGNGFVGVMLPYSPMHQLLVEAHSPLVVTSGNLTDEPIVRSNQKASSRLTGLADCFLLHNRDIHAVCDDSVVRCISGRLLPIRRSRGYAPMPVRLRQSGPSVLAVGGELKATFCV